MKNTKLIVFALMSCFMTQGLLAQNLSEEIQQPDIERDIRQSTQYFSPPSSSMGNSKVAKTTKPTSNDQQETMDTDPKVLVVDLTIEVKANTKKEVNPQKRKVKATKSTKKAENKVVSNHANTEKIKPGKLAKRSSQGTSNINSTGFQQKQSVPLDINKMRQDILSKLNKAKTQAERDKYQNILNQFDNKKH